MMESKRCVLFGVWDLLHRGHIDKFRTCKELGYQVIVGVVTDEFASSYKRMPIIREDERYSMVASCEYVDEVFYSEGDFKNELIFNDANIVAHGSDWSKEKYQDHTGIDDKFLKHLKIEYLILPYTEGISTTQLIKDKYEDNK